MTASTLATPAVVDLTVWRERRAWLAAARHLDALGLPPCVPCELVAWLHRHGVRSAWCQERAA
jgi:hypothetical protein